MTSTLRVLRTLALGAAVLLYATAAAPQSGALPQGHDHGDHAATVPPDEVSGGMTPRAMERIAALDKRIQSLATDMRMFSGEMKVDAMASLLTTLIERQSLMEGEMKAMREGMMRRMMEHREPPVAAHEQEPGGMCAPSN